MRGGPLSDPAVVDHLQPFIVSFWGQADREEPPEEVQLLYDQCRGPRGSNVTCFVLDSKGRLLRAFNGFPTGAKNPSGRSFAEISKYFIEEITKATSSVALSKRSNPRTLPDVEDGVRVLVRLKDSALFRSYASPVVEVVEDRGEWEILALPSASCEIDAAKLGRWLRLCYPPGINEQLEPYQHIEGTLTLRASSQGKAILSGKVRLGKTNGAEQCFEGTFEAAVTYGGKTPSVRGVLEGSYRRHDSKRGERSQMKLVAAIESRPK